MTSITNNELAKKSMTFKRKGKLLFIATHLAFIATTATAVVNGASWTSSPFEQKVFVENKGQFDGKNGSEGSKILFGTSINGVDLYFSRTGITYSHEEVIPMTEEEKEKIESVRSSQNESEEERRMVRREIEYLFIEWVGSNPAVEIIPVDPVSFYYTYSDNAGTITAHAYKKIVYKSLYPGIDVEYVFPEDKKGIKYTIVVHPGADPSVVKTRYSKADGLSLDGRGNVVIKSSFGEFVDHAPITTVENLTIPSSFLLNDNEVSFTINAYDTTRTLVIDPWTTNPNYPGYNAAYDVNYDLNGNVYVYGSDAPFKLAKLDNVGIVQWIFSVPVDFDRHYGDFAVDEINGTSYVIEGGGGSRGAKVLKVNTAGIQTGMFPRNRNMQEMWRAEYNRCINKIVIAGGGTSSPYQAAMLDTTLASITPVNVLSARVAFKDFTLLAVDNDGKFCYMATARSSGAGDSTFDNILIKCPIPNLVPTVFSVSDGHKFGEGFGLRSNGMNGMAVSPSWLYTYDSDSLKRWDKNTGTFITGIHASPVPATRNPFIQISWGGLSVDECDNIYVGVNRLIKKYTSSFILADSFTLTDPVYDVKLGIGNKLYACGKGFVTQLDVQQSKLTFTTTMPVSCDSCRGTATVHTCTNNPAGISYSWNTTPVQTTQTATGLCPGTYTVTVTRNCSINVIDSVTISAISLKPIITMIGKRPGDEMLIPILFTPSTKLTAAKEFQLVVKYDPALLRFVIVKSSVGTVSKVNSLNGELTFTVTPSSPLPTPTATIAELQMQALLAPYANGEVEVTQSIIKLESGEQITGGNCPVTFTLDSSCVMPHDVRKRPSAEITGIYPNPARTSITMEVYAENDPDVRIEVYDVFGRQIETVFENHLGNGKNDIVIVTENYANGIYFCRLVNGFKMVTKAFNVQR